MKSIIMKSALVFFTILLSSSLFAESVFLSDGSIMEGKISRETDQAITITLSNNLETVIPRKRVLRVIYHEEYKKAVNLHMADGTVVKGYVVEENNTEYVVRPDLNSGTEVKVKKSDVDAVVKADKEGRFAAKPPRTGSGGYAVAGAVISSMIPFWSGSFNDGFQKIDGIGIAFVIIKCGLPLISGILGPMGYMGNGPEVPIAVTAIWSSFYIGDMIFAGVIINKGNKARNAVLMNDDESTIAFSLAPKYEYFYDQGFDLSGHSGSIDAGVNVSAVCRW